MEHEITVLVSLVGAAVGGLGGTVVGYYLRERSKKQEMNRILINQYISQFQWFAESLWHRLHNVVLQEGLGEMTKEYFVQTTLYVLAGFLAYKWVMTLEGIYAQMIQRDLKLDSKIKDEIHDAGESLDDMGRKFGLKFFNYDRQSLAESVLIKDGEVWRVLKFIEFKKKYPNIDGDYPEIAVPLAFVKSLYVNGEPKGNLRNELIEFMNKLDTIVKSLEIITKIKPKTIKI